MATEQQARAAIRRYGCLLQVARVVFVLVFFLIFIISVVYLHSIFLSFIPAIIFMVVGGLLLSRMIAHQKQREQLWLEQYGTAIQVPVARLEKKETSRGTRNQPLTQISSVSYSLKLNWISPDGRKYTFKRELETPPSSEQQYAPGTLITVHIDPADPSLYRVTL
jgi:hypothetical protein